MKKFKMLLAISLVIVLLFSTSACSFRFSNFEELIRPPKLSGKYQGLQDSFEKTVGVDFTLLTPENGEFQSAFVTFDCDSDNEEEALVFFTTKAQPDVAQLFYFEYGDEEWVPVSTQNGLGNSIDKIIFTDINRDGFFEIVIGWNLFSSKTNKAYVAYSVKNNKLIALGSYPYTYFDVLDVNGDGLDDILTLTVDSSVPELLTATARVYNYDSQSTSIVAFGETYLDGNIASYSSVMLETVEDTNLIYIEANKGQNGTITEIIYWDDLTNTLVSPLFDVVSQSTKLTWRNIKVTAFDVDGDKYLEIPTSVEMPGSAVMFSDTIKNSAIVSAEDIVQTPVYFTKWVKFRNNRLKPVQYSIINETLGYMLNIKSSWVGRITVSGIDGQWDYYRWDSSRGSIGDLLFSIYAYDKSDAEQKKQFAGYKELTSSASKTYVYQITDAGTRFGVKENTLETNFIISDFGGVK